jgi:hypothetical protein
MAHEQECSGNQKTKIYGKQGSLAVHCVDDRSRWSLHRDPDQPTESENVADAAGIPSTRSKIGSQEGTEAGLHVGEEEVQPFERPQTPLFSWCRSAHRTLSSLINASRSRSIDTHDDRHLQTADDSTNLIGHVVTKTLTCVRFLTCAHRSCVLGEEGVTTVGRGLRHYSE